ncbi:putative Phox domain-containing protein [Plasmopara halstedii]
MNTAAHSLSAFITSALALKPSTVYILRVENTQTRQCWHIRRCFSEFCELREKILSLIDDQMAAYLTSSETDEAKHSIDVNTPNITSSASTSCNISSLCGKHRHHHSVSHAFDRFAYVFKQFPHRRLFRSRSKSVIEARSLALNCFLQQTLEVVEVVHRRQLIAICFSMMTHIETFLGCADHRKVSRNGVPESFSAARRASAAMSLACGFHHQPLVPPPAFTMSVTDQKYRSNLSRYRLSSSEEDESGANTNGENDAQGFNNFDFTQRFYRDFGRQGERGEMYGKDLDDEEEVELLQKTRSTMLERETQARKLHYSGSHFSMLESGQMSAKSRARRVEIASTLMAAKQRTRYRTTCLIRKISEPAAYETKQRSYYKYTKPTNEASSDLL